MTQSIRRDFTDQENVVAKALDSLGLRYEQQVRIGKYIVDFYIPEIQWVIEADGLYGHFKKADRKRDALLTSLGVKHILHVTSTKNIDIMSTLKESLE